MLHTLSQQKSVIVSMLVVVEKIVLTLVTELVSVRNFVSETVLSNVFRTVLVFWIVTIFSTILFKVSVIFFVKM